MRTLFFFLLLTAVPVFAGKPPVFTDFIPLSEQELQNGTIRLFDGTTSYGWKNAVVKGGVLLNTGKLSDSPLRFFSDVNPPDKLTAENAKYKPQHTVALFDGKTLAGWNVIGDIKVSADNGAIKLTGGSGALESAEKYGDFLLQLTYKTNNRVNSGVFFRCIPGEKMNGYECQICNRPSDSDYEKYIGTDTGGLFRRQAGRNVCAKDGVWNEIAVAVKGNEIATWVNGIQVIDFVDTRKNDANPRKGCRTEAGTIQLQGHDADTEIWFKNIRIQGL